MNKEIFENALVKVMTDASIIEHVKEKDKNINTLMIKYSQLLDMLYYFYSNTDIELKVKPDFVLKVSKSIFDQYKQLLYELSLIDNDFKFDENNILYMGIKLEIA